MPRTTVTTPPLSSRAEAVVGITTSFVNPTFNALLYGASSCASQICSYHEALVEVVNTICMTVIQAMNAFGKSVTIPAFCNKHRSKVNGEQNLLAATTILIPVETK